MEEWRDIAGYEGRYKISNQGRLMGFGRENGKILTTTIRSGYKVKNLYKDWHFKGFKIHRLVAQAFIPNPDNKPMINHINGIKTDNRADNLQWCTASENRKHADSTGLRIAPFGTEHFRCKLTPEDVLYIRANYVPRKNGYASLARQFSMGATTIKHIVLRKLWKHI